LNLYVLPRSRRVKFALASWHQHYAAKVDEKVALEGPHTLSGQPVDTTG